MSRFGLALLLVPVFFSTLSHADDWPQFLGPNRNGTSNETGLIDQFGQDGPAVSWRTPLGVGMSGMVIADNTLCTMYQDNTNQYVVALNATTGETRWTAIIAPAYENSMGDGPRSTPTISNGQVFAMSGDGTIASFSLENGQKQWSYDSVGKLGGREAEYGMASSPLVTKRHVVLTVGLPQATVVALNRHSGEVAWTAGTDNPAGYSSPALLIIHDSPQIVAFHGNGVLGLDPLSGQQLWSYPYKTDYDCNIATPLNVSNHVLISAGENHGTTLLKIPSAPSENIQEVWSSLGNRSILRNEWQTSTLIDGYLYGFDNVGSAGPVTNLTCVDALTGKQLWLERRFGKGNAIAADGKLWCSTMDGELVLVEITPAKFNELARTSLLGKTRQAPALANGKLYMRDDREVISIDIRK